MLASELTDEDIGRAFWVPVSAGLWVRIIFLGRSQRSSFANGGWPFILILKAAPTQQGQTLMRFRQGDGGVFQGVMVASAAEVYPVEIDYAVTADGEIIELGERPDGG